VQALGYHVYFHGQKAITAWPCSRAGSVERAQRLRQR
jgi:hypothetical protein